MTSTHIFSGHHIDVLGIVVSFLNGRSINTFAQLNNFTNDYYHENCCEIYRNLLRSEFEINLAYQYSGYELMQIYFKHYQFTYNSDWAKEGLSHCSTLRIDPPVSRVVFLPKVHQRTAFKYAASTNSILTNKDPCVLVPTFHTKNISLLNLKKNIIEKEFIGHQSGVFDVCPVITSDVDFDLNPVGAGHPIIPSHYNISSSLFNDRLLSSSNTGEVLIWNLDNAKVVSALEGHTAAVNSVRCSRNTRTAVTGSYDKSIRLWDLNQSKSILVHSEAHSRFIYEVRYLGDEIVSAGKDGCLKLWDFSCPNPLVSCYTTKNGIGNSAPIYSMDTFDSYVVFVDNHGALMLMDRRDGLNKVVKTNESSLMGVCLHVSMDQSKCVASYANRTVHILDRQLNSIRILNSIDFLAFGINALVDDSLMIAGNNFKEAGDRIGLRCYDLCKEA
ncbi:WD repeat-containing protein [Acrasis kona]|uniref:WD repeat-containing protein n=1 Tax=Acrasis kona TaxID=1008807 RepID=A0AAW2Z743_9EUKA